MNECASLRPFSRIPSFRGAKRKGKVSSRNSNTSGGNIRLAGPLLPFDVKKPFPGCVNATWNRLFCCPVYIESWEIFPWTVGVPLIKEHSKIWNNVHSWAQARSHSEGVSIFHPRCIMTYRHRQPLLNDTRYVRGVTMRRGFMTRGGGRAGPIIIILRMA